MSSSSRNIIRIRNMTVSVWRRQYIEFLGNKVVCHSIPIRPGRNCAIICESAAVNYRQKKMGYNAALELYNRVTNNIAEKSQKK